MKILAAGDIHGDTLLARSLASKAKKEKVDLVILCGDLTWFDEPTKGIIAPFKKNKQKVLIVPGNHDSFATTDFLAEFYGIKNIHGYYVKYEDIAIFGAGGTNEVGPNFISERETFNALKKSFEKAKNSKKTIMVTHEHPAGTSMTFGGVISGSKAVRKAIDQFKPDFVLCSHVHEAEGIEEKVGKTKVINVGRKGKILEI
ncbi:MAG: metallophosphoesterase family protein [Nanoarchaeota archaeon]|nr:metallophosphoesterase family protein [Nanoarchaeota archaeon]